MLKDIGGHFSDGFLSDACKDGISQLLEQDRPDSCYAIWKVD
jgi:hypothetical protein